MALMDTRIPLMGQGPDLVNVLANSTLAAQQQNQARQQNALAQLYQTQGPGIAAGETEALNALAQLSPEMALGIQDSRQTMDYRNTQMQALEQQMQMAREQARVEAEGRVSQMSAAEAAAEAQRLGMAIQSAYAMSDTPEGWAQALEMNGLDPSQYPFEMKDMFLAQVMGVKDAFDVRASMGPEESDAPDAFQTLHLRAIAAGHEPGSPGYQEFMQYGGPRSSDASPSAAEADIARLMEITNPSTGQPFTRDEAIQVNQLFAVSRDPLTGEVVIINRASGERVGQPQPQMGGGIAPAFPPVSGVAPVAPAQPAQVPPQPQVAPPGGDAREAFGLQGVFRSGLNVIGDTTGLGQPFPETGQAAADFAVLSEGLVNSIASAYARQPPSWLLQQINDLVPRPGRPFKGPEGAIQDLEALRRSFESELRVQTRVLEGSLSPTVRSETEQKIIGVESAIGTLDAAISRLQPAPPQETAMPESDLELMRRLGVIDDDGNVIEVR